jgi:signal transduction histidine kinase/HAMP domain-containing protein
VAGSDSQNERPIPFRDRLTVRLTGAVIAALLLIGTPFLVAFHKQQRDRQIEGLVRVADGVGRATVEALRAAMLAGTPHLLDDVVRDLSADESGVLERTLLFDHRGELQVASDETGEGRVVDRERDRTCTVCHPPGLDSPPERHTAVLRVDGRRVLRSVTTIPNEPQCHGCHDPAVPINGLLVMDVALSAADRRFLADIGSTVALGAVMVVLTVVVLVWLLRRLVHAPLQAVVGTSRKIAEGDLEARAEVAGKGEFPELASQLNRMTVHLARSLETVERQHRDLEAILDAIDDHIVVVDRGGRVVAANEAFRASGAEPADERIRKVFAEGRLQKAVFSRALEGGQDQVIEAHASPVRGPDGEVASCVEVRRDISERRNLEAVAAHSERLYSLGLLASGLSHEINNPLQAIASSVEGLRRRLPREPGISPEAAQGLEMTLARIGREVERGRVITHRLLKIARPPGETRSLCDVNHVVRDIVALLSHDIRRAGIRTRLELGDELPPLRADESRLGQVVMNLALNAIQAMEDGEGELHIATASEHGAVRMDVADTGCGIPPEQSKRIFEPFFTTKPVGKGTGLGLFITHQIVTGLGGTVSVRSRAREGAVFTVCLPRSRPGVSS